MTESNVAFRIRRDLLVGPKIDNYSTLLERRLLVEQRVLNLRNCRRKKCSGPEGDSDA
jgi:hypothetical protein